MCGIVGVVSNAPVNQLIYDALLLLQHRGQDAAGIMTVDGGELFAVKGRGLVRDVFEQDDMETLRGAIRDQIGREFAEMARLRTKRQLLDLAVKQELQRLAQLAAREVAARNEGAAMTYRTLAEVIPEIARGMTP
mgnify:CR=1 FL=1